jgi:hypothetical protein
MAEPSHLAAGSCYGLLRALSQGREHALVSRECLIHSPLRTVQEKYLRKGNFFATLKLV